jgi:hypothetical protein
LRSADAVHARQLPADVDRAVRHALLVARVSATLTERVIAL